MLLQRRTVEIKTSWMLYKTKCGANCNPLEMETIGIKCEMKIGGQLQYLLFQYKWSHVVSSQLIVLYVRFVTNGKRLGAPAATVTHICALQVLNVNFIYDFWVLLLDLKVDQAVSLLLLLGQEGANGQIAQQGQNTQEREQPEPLSHR